MCAAVSEHTLEAGHQLVAYVPVELAIHILAALCLQALECQLAQDVQLLRQPRQSEYIRLYTHCPLVLSLAQTCRVFMLML